MKGKAKRLEFHFRRRPGGELALEETRFWVSEGPPAEPTAQLVESGTGLSSELKPFRWVGSPGVRGLSILFLRHFANLKEGYRFEGPRGSVVASLCEAITFDQRAGLNWAARMFGHDNTDIPNLSKDLFACTDGSHTDEYRIYLGPAWSQTEFVVTVDGKPTRPSQYAALAQELEDAAPITVTGSIELQIAKQMRVGSGERKAKPALLWKSIDQPGSLPAQPGDLVRIRAQVTRPCHLCLVWIGPKGFPFLLYPWHGNGRWPAAGIKPSPVSAGTKIFAPEDFAPGAPGIPISATETGAETIIFLASREPWDFAALKKAFEKISSVKKWEEEEQWLPLRAIGRNRPPRTRSAPAETGAERGPNFEALNWAAQGVRQRHLQLASALADLPGAGVLFAQGGSFSSTSK